MEMSNHKVTQHERDVRAGAPILASLLLIITVAALLFLPAFLSFWVAVILPFIGIANYVQLQSKARKSGLLSLREKLDGESERRVFGGIALLLSVVAALVIAGLLLLLAPTVVSWSYTAWTAAALLWFLLSSMFWRFSNPTTSAQRDTATRAITYLGAIKSVFYAVFVQHAITQYLVGGNTITSLLIVAVVLLPLILWYRASLIYKVLGYHPSERWR